MSGTQVGMSYLSAVQCGCMQEHSHKIFYLFEYRTNFSILYNFKKKTYMALFILKFDYCMSLRHILTINFEKKFVKI